MTSTNSNTKRFLETIRQETSYPTFRAFVSTMTLLVYVLSGFIVAISVAYGQMKEFGAALIGAVCLALLGKVIAEISLMIADIADSTIYTSSKQFQHSNSASFESKSGDVEQAIPKSESTSEAPENLQSQMDAYGISFNGEFYLYKTYRYENLKDALAYAKSQSKT